MDSKNNKIKNILNGFTKSYIKKTENLMDLKFGFKVDENLYSVEIKEDGEFEITELNEIGELFSFVTDINTLDKIHLQKMTAMTAMGRETWIYKTPLSFINPESMPKNINPLNLSLVTSP